MKQLFLLTTLILGYSCKRPARPAAEWADANSLLTGEWFLDSSSNRFYSRDKLFILEDSSFYLFSGSDGGSLITTGKVIKDSVITDAYGSVAIHVKDSGCFSLKYEWRRIEDFYGRSRFAEDYRNDLQEALQKDSMRRKLLGWWKLLPPAMPVKMINSNVYSSRFVLHIEDDGKSHFYLDNKLDSVMSYTYYADTDGITFAKGCITDASRYLSFDEKGRMKLVINKWGDTLLLERIREIK